MDKQRIDWVSLAKQRPHEIVISGLTSQASEQFTEENGLNDLIYKIKCLNFLEISNTTGLKHLSPKISDLSNLTNLVLHGNKLTSIPGKSFSFCWSIQVYNLFLQRKLEN